MGKSRREIDSEFVLRGSSCYFPSSFYCMLNRAANSASTFFSRTDVIVTDGHPNRVCVF